MKERQVDSRAPSFIQRVRQWQERSSESKKKFLCVNCHTRPLSNGASAQRAGLCQKCYSNCAREECYYCEIDFVYLDVFKNWKANTRVVSCVDCIEYKNEHSMPGYCDTCKRQCAFKGTTCNRCMDGRRQFGEPSRCESCNQNCAFMEEESTEGLSLCHVCMRKHKQNTTKEEVKVDDLLAFGSDEDAYAQYVSLLDQVQAKEEDLKRKQARVSELVKRDAAAIEETSKEKDAKAMLLQLRAKKADLHKKKIDLVRLESRGHAMETRVKIDKAQEKSGHDGMQYALERARIVMLVETARMETENVVIEQELHRTDCWPPPWHEEDREFHALEQKARDEENFEQQMEIDADEFLDGTVTQQLDAEEKHSSFQTAQETRGNSDEEDFLVDDQSEDGGNDFVVDDLPEMSQDLGEPATQILPF